MGGVSLLAASLVVAALGFGWLNAIKEGVFDFLSFFRSDRVEEVMDDDMDRMDRMEELERDSAERMEGSVETDAEISVDPEFDEELNALDEELDALLEESEGELDAMESEL